MIHVTGTLGWELTPIQMTSVRSSKKPEVAEADTLHMHGRRGLSSLVQTRNRSSKCQQYGSMCPFERGGARVPYTSPHCMRW
jgi:hypothetical protein